LSIALTRIGPTAAKKTKSLISCASMNGIAGTSDAWDHDMLAVSDYVKVNPLTLEKYIRRSYEKYRPV
jgi:hypothetical protein